MYICTVTSLYQYRASRGGFRKRQQVFPLHDLDSCRESLVSPKDGSGRGFHLSVE